MMKQAQQMQKKMQEEIALIRVEASAGGGMVTVKMDGQKNVWRQDRPRSGGRRRNAAGHGAGRLQRSAKKVDEETQEKMGGMLGGMGLPPGMF